MHVHIGKYIYIPKHWNIIVIFNGIIVIFNVRLLKNAYYYTFLKMEILWSKYTGSVKFLGKAILRNNEKISFVYITVNAQ